MKKIFRFILCVGLLFLMPSELLAQKIVKFGKSEDMIRKLQKKHYYYPKPKDAQKIRESLFSKEKIEQVLSADTIYVTYSWDYEDANYCELIWNNLGQKIEFNILYNRIKDEKTVKWMPKIECYDRCSGLKEYFYDIMNMPKPFDESMMKHSLASQQHSFLYAMILVKRAEGVYDLYQPTEKPYVDECPDFTKMYFKDIEIDKLFNEFFNIEKVE